MDSHLGPHRHDPDRDGRGNSRHGHRAGPVPAYVEAPKGNEPRDRRSSRPSAVAQGGRLASVDDEVISLAAKGFTTREVQAHLAEAYGAQVSRDTIRNITGRALDGMAEWCDRPLAPVYAVLFVDAIRVKIRDGRPPDQCVYVAVGVTADEERDILGLWAGRPEDGEDAGYWLRILTEIRNRGTQSVLIVVCDELRGLSDALSGVWPAAITETCIAHLLRLSFQQASRRDWGRMAKDLKPIYNAGAAAEALECFGAFSRAWEPKYPAIVRLWEDAWPGFVSFLAIDHDIRTVIITTTDAVDRLIDRLRRAVDAREHFSSEQSALRYIYLVIVSVGHTGQTHRQRSKGRKAALGASNVTSDGHVKDTRRYPAIVRWWKLALGLTVVLALGIWDVGVHGKQAQPTGHGTRSSAPTHVAVAPPPPGVIQPEGTPDFSATFTGSRLDTSLWATCYPWENLPTGCNNSGNPEYEWYLPSQDRVSGGTLHLDARQAPTAGRAQDGSPQVYACRSGMVTSYPGFRFKYGYLQIVARFPASLGMWPALWLAAADLHWPPEIDIIEGWDRGSPYTAAYLHPVGGRRARAVIPPSQAIGWHTFAVSWTKMQVTWLLDGRVVLIVRHHVPHVKMYFIADLAEIDPVHASQCHGSMLIRSVKYWKN